MVEGFLRDLRIGLRVLVKEKAFCALAVAVLALGIAAVTSMFSVVNGVMLRGFSFPEPQQLVSVTFIDPTTETFNGVNNQVFSLDYQEFRPRQQSLGLVAAYLNGSTVNVTSGGQPRRYTGAYTTEDFFRALGVAPIRGRDFTEADNQPGAPKVAIIGYGTWQRDFGAAEEIIGTAVRINGKPATIVGVMPQGFAFPTNEEIWIPLFNEYPPRARTDPSGNSPAILGRLKPGVTIDQATAEFTSFARHFAEAFPDTNKAFNTGRVRPLIETFTPPSLRGQLWTMFAFCVGVLLIACVNVMNMQFARATLRARELAVRSSLGATRARVIRQMLTESLLVAGLGAGVGILLARGAVSWLSAAVRNLDNPPPSWITFDVDGRALAITIAAMMVAAVASGLLPAWMSSRASAAIVLREGGRGTTSRAVAFISRGLVVFQLVVTCVLLIGATLQVRSLLKQQTIDYGYDTAGLMSARMGLMEGDYPTNDRRKVFYDRVIASLSETPEFEAAALTNRFRMVFSGTARVEVDGKAYASERDRLQANFEQVTPGFFDVTGQKLIEGRRFADDDLDSRQPVAIVNAAFAQKLFAGGGALGHRFRTVNRDGTQPGPWRTVVGVVTTIRMLGPFNNPGVDESGYYVPFYASPVGPAPPGPFVGQFTTVLVRPRGGQSAELLANAVRREVRKLDPNLPLYFVGTPKSQLDGFVAPNRILGSMFSSFGIVAFILAAAGIYGVMSFSVNQRRQEFGVRMALGASSGKIMGMVLRQGSLQVILGLVLGIGLALGLGAVIGDGIQQVLFGVTAFDPVTYTAVISLVAVVSLIATFLPARRATRVDPHVACRAD